MSFHKDKEKTQTSKLTVYPSLLALMLLLLAIHMTLALQWQLVTCTLVWYTAV